MSDTIVMLFMLGIAAEMMGIGWLAKIMLGRGVAALSIGVSIHYLIYDKIDSTIEHLLWCMRLPDMAPENAVSA